MFFKLLGTIVAKKQQKGITSARVQSRETLSRTPYNRIEAHAIRSHDSARHMKVGAAWAANRELTFGISGLRFRV